MSGGSYDYLYSKEADDLLHRTDTIQEMADRLAELGYHGAAVESNELLADVRRFRARIEARMKRLSPVWRAVEWLDSGDSGPEQVKSAVAAFLKVDG
jgi:hypothetical protein